MKKSLNSASRNLTLLLLLGLATQAVNTSIFRFLSPKYTEQQPERMLSSGAFGGYTIVYSKSPDGCEDKESFTFSEEKFNKGFDGLNLFSFARSSVEKYILSPNKDTKELRSSKVIVSAAFIVVSSTIAIILSVFLFLIFIIYFFCNCICKVICCCCKEKDFNDFQDQPGQSEQRRQENAKGRSELQVKMKELTSQGCKKCIVGTSLILIAAITILGVIWVFMIFKSISGLQSTRCSAHSTFETVKSGYKSQTLEFGGLKGMKFLVQKISDSLDSIQVSDLDAIIAENLHTKAGQFTTELNTVFTNKATYATTSCNPSNSSPVQADFIKSLTSTFNEGVKAEADKMIELGNLLNNAATSGKDAVSTQKATYKTLLADFNTQIDSFISSLESTQKTTTDVSDRKELAKLVAYIIALGILVLMVLFALLMWCSMKNKCHECSSFF
jgi:hypothetical protein